ncbi:Cullin-4 [Kappamyces sp. JEL0829]|nr:Cullin-4 [Kappamyces sp. JEL0829]
MSVCFGKGDAKSAQVGPQLLLEAVVELLQKYALVMKTRFLEEAQRSELLGGSAMELDDANHERAQTIHQTLVYLLDGWKTWLAALHMLSHILLWLDKTYLLLKGESILALGKDIWKQIILQEESLGELWILLLRQGVALERSGEFVEKSTLKHIIEMWHELNMYYSLEALLLQDARDFYGNWARNATKDLELWDFQRQVLLAMAKELDKCHPELGFLLPATKKPLSDALEQTLIKDHISYLKNGLQSRVLIPGFPDLAKQGEARLDDVKVMYELFERVRELDVLKTAFYDWIHATGLGMVQDTEKDAEMISGLLDFQTLLTKMVAVCCRANEKFSQAQKESFSSFLNKRQNKPAELIAGFIDKVLKSGKLSDAEVENKLDGCLALFRLVQGKDVFEAFYGKALAKRLLLNKSASVDAEKSMLVKLKSECGAGFTTKLEGMFKDIDLSREVVQSFQDTARYANRLDANMEFSVNVLTASYWPTYPQIELNLPADFSKYQEVFKGSRALLIKDFYTSKYNGRRITWAMSLGHCQVSYKHPKGAKDLIVSLYQTITLLLFNTRESMTTAEVQRLTGLDKSDVDRTLLSLSLGKVKIFKKNPHVKHVLPTDVWSINPDFTHPQRRIVVNTIQASESPQEVQATTERVFEDRAFAVDAAIVRIMKTKKKITFKALVADIFETLKFPMEVRTGH